MPSIKPFSFALGAMAGGAAEYFLDPQQGNRRRSVAGDKLGKYARQTKTTATRQAGQAADAAKGTAYEAAKSATGRPDSSAGTLNDPALARKVETEVFRSEDAPKDRVNVNVEAGVVYMRGQVDDEEQIEALVEAASKVDGVSGVKSLMHTPDTPAPTKS